VGRARTLRDVKDLVLQAGDDLVARIAREGDPIRAVAELIWNGIDAEATQIAVELQRADSGAIVAITVTDNGHGISSDEVEATFGRIGDSWKKLTLKSKNGKRYLHGKLGEGRLRAFALGGAVTWSSHSENSAGDKEQVTITGHRENRQRFRWNVEPATVSSETGTVVTIDNDEQKSLSALEADAAIPALLSHFAPVLLLNSEDLEIVFDTVALDPQAEIIGDYVENIEFGADSNRHAASVRVIEWRSGKHRAVYVGADSHHFIYEESGKDLESQFPYSAYVTWPDITTDQMAVLSLHDLAPEPVSSFWPSVAEAVRGHFATRRMRRRREQLDQWKSQGVYPYDGEPTTEAEIAERTVFDVVSGAVATQISSTQKDARLTLALLRDAIRHDPGKLTAILHEVVALSNEDRQTLTRLLGETSLAAIIRSANLVASRQKFLAGLEHLLFDPTDAPGVGERDHLHKILENELWVFGEGYHLMRSESGLTQMLRTHLQLEGLPTDTDPVVRWDGTRGRVDLHLAAQYKEHDHIRHLVVELKAPGVTLSQRELNQVEGYSNVVRTNAAFATERSSWDFILVGSDYDELVDDRIHSEHRETGRFLDPTPKPGRPRVRAFVRRWRDLIDENRRRLDFVTSALEHDPSISDGLQYVREQYREMLPTSLRDDAGNLEGATEASAGAD